jgi:hypothetical protein
MRKIIFVRMVVAYIWVLCASAMQLSDNILPSWISRQATLGPNVQVDGTMTNDNAFWYFLTVCCPQIFDSYAIILHPFWINWRVKDLVDSGLRATGQKDNKDFKRVSWRDFFSMYGKTFDLTTAYKTQLEINEDLRNNFPPYLWYPAEGDCEDEELGFVLKQLSGLYGDLIANFYYCLLKTQKWDTEYIYRGKLSEFDELKSKIDLRDNPTAIYPDNKEWCIVTDYDLQFTYLGGKKELIDKITNDSRFEIFKLEQMFIEKPERTCT